MRYKTIAKEGQYKVVEDTANVSPYAVFKYTGDFWQQVSDWYFYRGVAISKFKRLLQGGE